METIEFLKEENNRLREIIGSWRRLAQEKRPRCECIREGYTTDYGGYHYMVYAVRNIPVDLPMEDVLLEICYSFLPEIYPYQFRRVDYSKKYNGWLVEVQKRMEFDMFFEPNKK